MTQDLVSSAPGIYTAFLGLAQTAGAVQTPAVAVFAFELGQYEPGSYLTVHAIENHEWSPETIGTFSQTEGYDIVGCATVFSGDSPNTNPSVATTVLSQTYSLFQACVMTPVMSNRTMPILGTTGPSPYQMLPGFARYTGGLGNIGGSPAGWAGVLEFSFHFDAYISPG
jgi:hypothetical protein